MTVWRVSHCVGCVGHALESGLLCFVLLRIEGDCIRVMDLRNQVPPFGKVFIIHPFVGFFFFFYRPKSSIGIVLAVEVGLKDGFDCMSVFIINPY